MVLITQKGHLGPHFTSLQSLLISCQVQLEAKYLDIGTRQ